MQGVKRFGAFLVLALSMLLMQQGGLRHALQHSAHDNDGLPGHSTLCKECLSFCAHDDLEASTVLFLLFWLIFKQYFDFVLIDSLLSLA